jgi:uncharacterized protein (DUF433 family)
MHERIEINLDVMGGKPVIRGTCVPVEILLRASLGAGMTPEEIIADQPRLTAEEDIRAAHGHDVVFMSENAPRSYGLVAGS